MTTILLCEMTIQTLFNMSKIQYDPNQSFEDKITILKNANLLQKEQNYSNNVELSQNHETAVIPKSNHNIDFELLCKFFTDNSDSADYIKQMYLMPCDKNKEGAYFDNLIVKYVIKKDFNTQTKTQMVESIYDESGNLILACHFDFTGKYIAFDTVGGSTNGDWYCSKTSGSIVVITESKGVSEYHGGLTYFHTQTTKTIDGKFYSECRTKFFRNDPYVFDGFSRFVPIDETNNSNPPEHNKLTQMKEGKWLYKTTYYYVDDLKNLVGPKSYETEITIEKLKSEFYKATVVNTDYSAILNVIKMNNKFTISGNNTTDDRQYELIPTKFNNFGQIIEVNGYDQSTQGTMLSEGGIKAICSSKIYAKYIRD